MTNNHIMREAILNFTSQFKFEPKIENEEKLIKKEKVIVAGMGGSHLGGDIIKMASPNRPVLIHEDYGLPRNVSESDLRESIFIASSYSGNTEEAIEAFEKAREAKLNLAVIAVGGKLMELARESGVPFVKIPETGIQPRSALGFSIRGIAKLMSEAKVLQETGDCARIIDPKALEEQGKTYAEKIRNKVPVVCASAKNYAIAYNWKIKLNETGKIPAFYNLIPELNHNEMNGFDVQDATRALSQNFAFVFLKDESDHPQIKKRMAVTEKLYKDRLFTTEAVELKGQTTMEKVFTALVLADWTAYHTAKGYGLEANEVPMVEQFKSLIQ